MLQGWDLADEAWPHERHPPAQLYLCQHILDLPLCSLRSLPRQGRLDASLVAENDNLVPIVQQPLQDLRDLGSPHRGMVGGMDIRHYRSQGNTSVIRYMSHHSFVGPDPPHTFWLKNFQSSAPFEKAPPLFVFIRVPSFSGKAVKVFRCLDRVLDRSLVGG